MLSKPSRYAEVYAQWKRDPEGFWAEAARAIDWYKPWDRVFDPYAGQYGRWFAGAECNTAFNCLDRHVERGRAGQKALVYDSPVTNMQRSLTYVELRDEVATLGAVLQDLGVGKGDRVIIYMPMIPEAVMAMLACARIGAIHSVVFGGFAAPELATRIDDAKPAAVLSASCGIEPGRVVQYKPLLDAAIGLSGHKPSAVLMLQRPMAQAEMTAGRDHDWASAIADAKRRGRTVFLSSHILPEVEALCHRVAIIRDGRIVAVEQVATLKSRAKRRVDVRVVGDADARWLEGVLNVSDAVANRSMLAFVAQGPIGGALDAVRGRAEIVDVITHEPTLEDIFLSYYGGAA